MAYAPGAVERAMKVQEVIIRAIDGQLTWIQAAEILGLSARTVRRWRRRLEVYGYNGLFDRRRRVPSPRRAPVAEVQRLLALYREHYAGFNVRHFHQLARREHGVRFCYAFVKKALQTAGLVPSEPAAAIGASGRRARASASSCTWMGAGIAGFPACPTAGSPSSPWWTTPPRSCCTPSCGRAAKACRP